MIHTLFQWKTIPLEGAIMITSFPTIVGALLTFLLFSQGAKSQEEGLRAVKCQAEFAVGTSEASSIYAGDGRIYLFGGETAFGVTNYIYLYDVTADSLTNLGDMPTTTDGQALAKDAKGSLYHFGGYVGNYLDTIDRFNTSSNVMETVGSLPNAMRKVGALQAKEDSALVFGRNEVAEVDLTNYQSEEAAQLTEDSAMGVAWDAGDKVLLFYETEHLIYSISRKTLTNFTSPERHYFDLHHSLISTPTSAWIVGNLGRIAGRGNTIVEVDFQTLEFKFWPVDNYPAVPEEDFYYAATTYVPESNRLYIFGGWKGYSPDGDTSRREIWYIDLPEKTKVPSTTPHPCTGPDCSAVSKIVCTPFLFTIIAVAFIWTILF